MSAYAMCPLTAVPVRQGASHRSEMGSQLLFGEVVEVLEQRGRQWSKVRCCDDNFIGWAPSLQLQFLTFRQFEESLHHRALVLDLFYPLLGEGQSIPVTLGAYLPGFDGMQFFLSDQRYTFSGQAVFPEDIQPQSNLVLKVARRLLNTPFMWGGRTPMGIDGPALVQLVFKTVGYRLPRQADLQVNHGNTVHFVEQARPGDVAFFENNHGRISHAGILLGDGEIIHAFDKVRVDLVDHYGIFNRNLKRYTHRLRIVKRLLPESASSAVGQTILTANEPQQMALF